MATKKTEEPTLSPVLTGQILESTVDVFYQTAEGLESHLQIKGTTHQIVLAASQIATAAILEAGGSTRIKANNKNGHSTSSTLPYYLDDKGVKRCNRMTTEGERCGEPVSPREGKYGPFWSCKNYRNHAKTNGANT